MGSRPRRGRLRRCQGTPTGTLLDDGACAGDRFQRPGTATGTGHGQREPSRVRNTAFERDTAFPTQQVQVRYDSERNLVARGIIPRSSAPVRDEPQAFPGQYVPDPPPQHRR